MRSFKCNIKRRASRSVQRTRVQKDIKVGTNGYHPYIALLFIGTLNEIRGITNDGASGDIETECDAICSKSKLIVEPFATD